MDEPQLLAKLMKLWDVTENPATKFACDDRLEKSAKTCFAFTLSTIEATVNGSIGRSRSHQCHHRSTATKAAWAIVKVANVLQTAQDKQMRK
ncbi:hypothetical protein ACHAW6_014019 [Cyclotella cf. meneghiniana]